MALHDLLHIGLGLDAVSDSFGIDDHAGALRAIIEAAGLIRANHAFQVESFGFLFEAGMKRIGTEF